MYDILVKVDKFIFPVNFIVLDCEIDAEILIIIGQPSLATGKAIVDVESGDLKFRVTNKEVNFNFWKFIKYPDDMPIASQVDVHQ